MSDYVGNYWQLKKDINKRVKELKLIGFQSWETGFSSTERKNIARVKKVLNTLDELNEYNLMNPSGIFFSNLREAIKDFMRASGYDVKVMKNTYSIRRAKK